MRCITFGPGEFVRCLLMACLALLTLHWIGQTRSAQAEGLSVDEFQELHRQLQVDADKPWRSIPWKTVLLDAQQAAAKQAKPIFIWAMDGHPLGCT